MIDPAKRGEIIDLKNKGVTQTEISKRTGVSMPTIRKIINEQKINNNQTRENSTIEELGERVRKLEENVNKQAYNVKNDEIPFTQCQFIINCLSNRPDKNYTPYEIFMNGIPSWCVEKTLTGLYPLSVTSSIMKDLKALFAVPQVYLVTVMLRTDGEFSTTVETLPTEVGLEIDRRAGTRMKPL